MQVFQAMGGCPGVPLPFAAFKDAISIFGLDPDLSKFLEDIPPPAPPTPPSATSPRSGCPILGSTSNNVFTFDQLSALLLPDPVLVDDPPPAPKDDGSEKKHKDTKVDSPEVGQPTATAGTNMLGNNMLKLISKSFSRDRLQKVVNIVKQEGKEVKLASEVQGNKLRQLIEKHRQQGLRLRAEADRLEASPSYNFTLADQNYTPSGGARPGWLKITKEAKDVLSVSASDSGQLEGNATTGQMRARRLRTKAAALPASAPVGSDRQADSTPLQPTSVHLQGAGPHPSTTSPALPPKHAAQCLPPTPDAPPLSTDTHPVLVPSCQTASPALTHSQATNPNIDSSHSATRATPQRYPYRQRSPNRSSAIGRHPRLQRYCSRSPSPHSGFAGASPPRRTLIQRQALPAWCIYGLKNGPPVTYIQPSTTGPPPSLAAPPPCQTSFQPSHVPQAVLVSAQPQAIPKRKRRMKHRAADEVDQPQVSMNGSEADTIDPGVTNSPDVTHSTTRSASPWPRSNMGNKTAAEIMEAALAEDPPSSEGPAIIQSTYHRCKTRRAQPTQRALKQPHRSATPSSTTKEKLSVSLYPVGRAEADAQDSFMDQLLADIP